MNVQIIENEGKPEFAVLPYADYIELIERLEDKEDLYDLQSFRNSDEETYPAEVVNSIVEGVSPIKVFRQYRGLTQNVLAAAISKSKVYIAKLEAGERKGSAEVIRDIAEILKVDIDLLI